MQKIRCLYLEDDEDQRDRYAGWLKRSWDNLKTGTEIEVITTDNPSAAIKMLDDASEKFSVFVVDILFKRDEPLGFNAMKQAREDYHDLAILALSVGGGGYEQMAIEAGADFYISKQYLAMPATPSTYLGGKLLDAIRKRGSEPVAANMEMLVLDEDDLSLVTLVDTIGRGNIINFVFRILEEPCSLIRPYYVRSGLSGASVLKVDCDINVGPKNAPRAKKLLLKVSREQGALRNEVLKDISMFPDELFVKFLKKDIVTSGGWYSVALNFQDKSKTLLDWLSLKEVSPDDVVRTLSKFFTSDIGLKEVYSNIGKLDEKRPNVALWEILSPSRRSRVRKALDEFQSLAKKYDPSGLFDFNLINAFIKAKRVDQMDEEDVPRGTSICWSHGDFHGRNILIKMINGEGIPYLIDPANVEEMHWAADIARLTVDLIVSGIDQGDESYEWGKMSEWCDLATKFIHGEALPKLDIDNPNKNIYAGLSWIRDNISNLHSISDETLKPEWEFELALAVEFLRSAYRHQDLSAPKRVLGLLAACEALRTTNLSFNKHKKGI